VIGCAQAREVGISKATVAMADCNVFVVCSLLPELGIQFPIMFLNAGNEAYRDIVANYCRVLERDGETPAKALFAIRNALIELYIASLKLPAVPDPTYDDLPDRISSEEYGRMKKKIGAYTREDHFWVCDHPFNSTPEKPLCVSLSDGLADIWRDLKRGLRALDEDEQRYSAAVFWDWKFSFDTHWGDHAVDSIWGIHALLKTTE
jgi:hypothetical protein